MLRCLHFVDVTASHTRCRGWFFFSIFGDRDAPRRCYGRLEGTSPCRPAPVFDLAVKAPPKAVVPHQSGYARLASATEVRDDVFENARADACAQLASSALRSCFRLKAAAPEVRLLLELCDDRGDGDDGPKAAKKAFHARCAYLANGAGALSLRKERWRARAVATARRDVARLCCER